MRDTLPVRVRFGDFELDVRMGELRQGDRTILLQEQPFRVLLMLIDSGGEAVTREEIQKKLWPNDTVVEFDQSINAAIKRLRKALGDSSDEPKYVETVARRGYRLMVPVQRVAAAAGDFLGSAKTPTQANPAGVGHPHDLKQPQSASLTGKTVSHYRVLEILGGGGMGLVYRAEDLKLGRAVALKFLPEELGDDPNALERFEREARAASALDHPNICSVHEFGEHEGQPFIVMQLLEGQTLREHLASLAQQKSGPHDPSQQAVPLEQLLNVASQIADGLQAAHENGIIHRDIKPANIFLTKRGLVKILDFGVAKLVQASEDEPAAAAELGPSNVPFVIPSAELRKAPRDPYRANKLADIEVPRLAAQNQGSSLGMTNQILIPDVQQSGLQPAAHSHLTRTGAAMGTAGYMSPEQIRGEKVDARTDLFSFGLVLYEMATGQRAFSGDTAAIVHDAVLSQMPTPVHERNPSIPPKLEAIINRAIEKDRERRYQTAAEIEADLQNIGSQQSRKVAAGESRKRFPWKSLVAAAATFLVAIIAGGFYWHSHQPVRLTDKDTIVLADFDNSTGDALFDDTLKQGLAVQLEQSPFLNLLSDRKVNQTLKEMGRNAGDPLTPEVTREICQRTGTKAMLTGSIAAVGNEYVIGVKAVNCNNGSVLAEAQAQAAGKDAVLKALDSAAVSLRSNLGESLGSVQKYATPLEEATTPSLEALRAYSQGLKAQGLNLTFFKRAVELDPNFAMPYAAMSMAYSNNNEIERAQENARKAYELRAKVSGRERLVIEAAYYMHVTGELEKAAQVYELWQRTYPRSSVPYGNLGSIYASLGNLEKLLEETQGAIRLEPNRGAIDLNLGSAYVNLNRLDEAESVYKQAEERKLGDDDLLFNRYQLAFLKGDTAQLTQLAVAARGKPSVEDLLLAYQADTEAWHGKLKNARELTRRAMDLDQHSDQKETAATYQAAAALREVESGNREHARVDADAAVKLAPNRDVRAMAALALARAGDTAGAEKLSAELDKTFPLDTLVQRYWLPTIGAAVALRRKDPNRAIELLKATSTIELGQPTGVTVFLCPVFLRGEAYLMLHDGKAAAVEFQKFIDHYGLVVNFPWGALARLGLARAYVIEAATDPAARDKARTAYQNFLALWKDADPDIPIYQQAKAEYAKLR